MQEVDIVTALERDRPAFHAGAPGSWFASPATLRALQQIVRPGARTLETGCGASTVVFAAAGASHVVVSPDVREHELVQSYCEWIGVDHNGVEFVTGSSDDVLPLRGGARELDVALIDGAHSFPYPVVDWHHVSRVLKIGGRLLLDDIPIPAVAIAFRFMDAEPNWRLDEIYDDRAALFTLLELPLAEGTGTQRSNRRYDFGFASPAHRLRLELEERAARGRYAASQRFPRSRRLWRRLAGPR